MEIEFNKRGFRFAKFTDLYGSTCSVQDSSLATDDAIWLGVETDFEGHGCTRMHLDRKHVSDLIDVLQRFVDNGSIAE